MNLLGKILGAGVLASSLLFSGNSGNINGAERIGLKEGEGREFVANRDGNYSLAGYEFYLERGSRLRYSDGQIRVGVNPESEIRKPEKKDKETEEIQFQFATHPTKKIELAGHDLTAETLYYEDEGFFIGGYVKIDGLELVGNQEWRTYIDFDRHNRNDSYIFMGDNSLEIKAKKELKFNFYSSNKYLRIMDGDAFNFKFRGGITIRDRKEDGLVPLMVGNAKDFSMRNGRVKLNKGFRFVMDKDDSQMQPCFSSTPVEVRLNNSTIIVDNFNRYKVVKGDVRVMNFSETKDFPIKTDLDYNYFGLEDFNEMNDRISNGRIIFSGTKYGHMDLFLGLFRDNWESMPPEIRESINGYSIHVLNRISDGRFSKGIVLGRVSDMNHLCEFDVTKVRGDIVRHEIAHMLDFELKKTQPDFRSAWSKITPKNEYHNSLGTKSYLWPEDRFLTSEEKEKFKEKYGRGWRRRPLHGFAEPYGKYKIFEDVATMAQWVAYKPSRFRKFLDKKSKEYDERYLRKIKLLRDHKFISEAEFRRVVKGK